MGAIKTQFTGKSVGEFLRGIDDPRRLVDCCIIAVIMRDATGRRTRLWGSSITGYEAKLR
jgi:hypothetical protein